MDSPFNLIGFSPDGHDARLDRDIERTDHTGERQISVVAAGRVVAARCFSVNGNSVYAELVGVWRDGTWK